METQAKKIFKRYILGHSDVSVTVNVRNPHTNKM